MSCFILKFFFEKYLIRGSLNMFFTLKNSASMKAYTKYPLLNTYDTFISIKFLFHLLCVMCIQFRKLVVWIEDGTGQRVTCLILELEKSHISYSGIEQTIDIKFCFSPLSNSRIRQVILYPIPETIQSIQFHPLSKGRQGSPCRGSTPLNIGWNRIQSSLA